MILFGRDLSRETAVIAEIGNNHEGDSMLAARMIVRAKEAGADAVKFQAIEPEDFPDRVVQLRKICLPWDQFPILAFAAKSTGIGFLATPFGLPAVEMLNPLVTAWKIAGRSCEDLPLIAACRATGKPLIISVPRGKTQPHGCYPLHVVLEYPTPPEHANLWRAGLMRGYSDHVCGIEAAVGAAHLGARIIEKHFTLDHNQSDFQDHKHAADPGEFKEMVDRIREATVLRA